jgi:hypothetical protein
MRDRVGKIATDAIAAISAAAGDFAHPMHCAYFIETCSSMTPRNKVVRTAHDPD